MEEGEAAGYSQVHFLFITVKSFEHGGEGACSRGTMLCIQWADWGWGRIMLYWCHVFGVGFWYLPGLIGDAHGVRGRTQRDFLECGNKVLLRAYCVIW